jgi:DNA-binding transcriptional regulator YiaG
MDYKEWETRVNRTMMAMEDLADDLNITMAEIEKWEKEGKVPEKAVKHLKFLEEDLD